MRKAFIVWCLMKDYLLKKVGEQFLDGILARLSFGTNEIVNVDPMYFRPTEVDLLIGDPTKSNEKLGWYPEYDLAGLISDMMQSDIKLMQKEILST